MIEPRWVIQGKTFIGVTEIPGPRHSEVIAGWLHRLNAWWNDDETPWCGVFVAAVFDQTGVPIAKDFFRARAWLAWGVPIPLPVLGCIVVFERGPKFGHVGFVVGRDDAGDLLVLGGNQGNAVSVASFPRDRVLGYRWPAGEPLPDWSAELPVGSAAGSTSEA